LPEFREIGVFKSMYNYVLEDLAKSDEISGLRLYVDRRNLTAIQVYEKMGMDGSHYQLFEWMKQKP
jgi:ribosomal protein S18 acetylase RimI-like enzyme